MSNANNLAQSNMSFRRNSRKSIFKFAPIGTKNDAFEISQTSVYLIKSESVVPHQRAMCNKGLFWPKNKNCFYQS